MSRKGTKREMLSSLLDKTSKSDKLTIPVRKYNRKIYIFQQRNLNKGEDMEYKKETSNLRSYFIFTYLLFWAMLVITRNSCEFEQYQKLLWTLWPTLLHGHQLLY